MKKTRRMKRKNKWYIHFIDQNNSIPFNTIKEVAKYTELSWLTIQSAYINKLINIDQDNKRFIVNRNESYNLSDYSSKKRIKHKIKKVKLINGQKVVTFNSVNEAADYLQVRVKTIFYMLNKKTILNGWIATTTDKPNYADYKPMNPHHYHNHTFYQDQDRIADIERGIPIFDSITGINERKVKAHKNTYRLTEEEAIQQGLTSVFGGSIYIDKTKHLYAKKDGHYYLICNQI